MHTTKAATLTELHDKLCFKLIHAPMDKLDLMTSVDVQLHNTVSQADSMAWSFDLKNLWLTPGRWSMMVRQYIDPDDLKTWLGRSVAGIGLKGRGISVMRTKLVRPRGGPEFGNRETRRWGSCMLAFSYKAVPQPTISLHSRTSYLGYIGALDLSVAWMCARYLAKELDVHVEDFKFVWYNEALQWHNFKSLAYLLNNPDKETRKRFRRLMIKHEDKLTSEELLYVTSSPALTLSRTWMQKVVKEDEQGITYGDMSYNTYRRIRRRYHTEVRGYDYAKQYEGWSYFTRGDNEGQEKEYFAAYKPLSSVDIHDLDLKSVGMPFSTELGFDAYEGGDMDTDEEEEE